MEITTEMIQAAYSAAKDVYEERTVLDQAKNFLEENYGMNRNSSNDYIQGFKKMMDGERYTRTLKTEATDYYFSHIHKDYGLDALRKALQAAEAHVEYYEDREEKRGRGKLNEIREVISKYKALLPQRENHIFPDEVPDAETLREGQKKTVFVNVYERNRKARAECINHYGTSCSVCDMNFGEVYGDLGEGFIHVHHLIPVHQLGEQYEVDPIKDLRPVCPNCHAMLHRGDSLLSIDKLKKILRKA